MQCDCDDTIDDPMAPSKICKKHFSWVERLVLLEREACALLAEQHTGMWDNATAEKIARNIRERSGETTG